MSFIGRGDRFTYPIQVSADVARSLSHPLSPEKGTKAGNRFSPFYLIYRVKCLWTVELFDQCVSDLIYFKNWHNVCVSS